MNPTTDQLKKLQAEITQGEWRIDEEHRAGMVGPIVGRRILDRDLGHIATLQTDEAANFFGETGTPAANAQAIALVPEMIARILELQEALLAYVEQEEYAAPYSNSPMRIKARAALGG